MKKRLKYYDLDLSQEIKSEFDFLKNLEKSNPVLSKDQSEELVSKQTEENNNSKVARENKSNTL